MDLDGPCPIEERAPLVSLQNSNLSEITISNEDLMSMRRVMFRVKVYDDTESLSSDLDKMSFLEKHPSIRSQQKDTILLSLYEV